MALSDVGDVDLLEWSHELDRSLLAFAFRPLKSTTDNGSACFLYKLALSSSRKEMGLVLLDCDAGAAFYEGISLRTLDRRTQMSATATGSSTAPDDASHLESFAAAFHHALEPQTALDPALRTTICVDSTRFSSSLSVSVRSKNDADDSKFKTSFDLDPLDHSSVSNLLSSHFVRPLLNLATILARSASPEQLHLIYQSASQPFVTRPSSSASLELMRRSALSQAGLPIEPVLPLPNVESGTPAGSSEESLSRCLQKRMTTRASQTKLDGLQRLDGKHTSSASKVVNQNQDSDDASDMFYFGPPGCKLAQRARTPDQVAYKVEKQLQSLSQHDAESDQDDGDVTLIAPVARLHTDTKHAECKSDVRSILAYDDDDQHTSEEESLPILDVSDAAHPTAAVPNAPASVSKHCQAPERPVGNGVSHEAKATQIRKHTPDGRGELTPPPPTFVSSCLQQSPSKRNAEREEQQRRRQQIANIKRGASSAPNGSASSVSTSAAIRSATASRKRSRF